MKFVLPSIAFAALFVLNGGGADARLFGNGNANENAQGPPDFLTGDDLPPGLVDNPSGVIGVDIKPGRSVAAQNQPDKDKKKKKIRGLDNKPIDLDTEAAERINLYNPDQFVLSADGTSVTDAESGEIYLLNVFYTSDGDNDVTFVIDDDGGVANVRVTPKANSNEGLETAAAVQNFQRLTDSDVLVGYYDDDMDLTNAPSFADPPESVKEDNLEGDDGTRRRVLTETSSSEASTPRRAQATYSKTMYGRTCTTWDYLDVNIVTDSSFRSKYSSHSSKAYAIFAEAAEIYWKESCVHLWMWRYENTVGNSNWVTSWGTSFDTYVNSYTTAGCTSAYGALDLLRYFVKSYRSTQQEDAWHLFSGRYWTDAAGCAWINVCKSLDKGYGVNRFDWTDNLRLQAVEFAHELGHNLGLNHLGGTWGRWVMEPIVNLAYWDLEPTHANNVRNKVVHSSSCGYY